MAKVKTTSKTTFKTTTKTTTKPKPYPADLTITYPTGPRDRATAFFRLILALPIWVIVGVLCGGIGHHPTFAGFLFLPTLLMLLFRQKYPRWWFDWNLAVANLVNRAVAYTCLLTDRYPSTDEAQDVLIKLDYPDAEHDLNRWLPLVKWFLAIPHIVCLIFLALAAAVTTLIAWFAVLFTGKYPQGLFDFVVGVLRWSLRVSAYTIILTTDQYPPFSLE